MEGSDFYLDAAATTPPLPAVIAAMQQVQQTCWANPSSLHRPGLAAAEALERARWRLADRFAVQPDQLIVTSGATESVHLAIQGCAARLKPGRIVISAVEHPAVIAAAMNLQARGWMVETWPVDAQGLIRLEELNRLLSPPTQLVSLIAAQSEIGAVQPIRIVAQACRQRGIVMHTDATQLIPQGCCSFDALGVDLLSVSAHKFQGPRGVGLLIRSRDTELHPLQGGGGQEHGLRSGTEPVALVTGMAEALAVLPHYVPDERICPPGSTPFIQQQRDALLASLLKRPGVSAIGPDASQRLPHHISLLVTTADGVPIPGRELVRRLAAAGVSCSSGSACSSGASSDSPVLSAMQVLPSLRRSGIRLTLGPWLTSDDLKEVARRFETTHATFS